MHTDTVTELLVDTSRGEKMDIHVRRPVFHCD